METKAMEEAEEIFSMQKDTKTFKSYLFPSNGKRTFEVKDHERVVFKGESFQKARSVYEDLCRG
jgi:hypothetical protein